MDLRGIKNIIFDLGGVILDIDYNLTVKAFEDLGIIGGSSANNPENSKLPAFTPR